MISALAEARRNLKNAAHLDLPQLSAIKYNMENRNWINEIVDQAQQEVERWPIWMQRPEVRDVSPKRLSNEEFKQLLELLSRFCDTDLDQFDHWKLATNAGHVFVDIGRRPSHDYYRSMI